MSPKASELTVTINAKLDVDRKTAETCLRLVEAYVNANCVDIICTVKENGEKSFKYHHVDLGNFEEKFIRPTEEFARAIDEFDKEKEDD